METFKLCPTCGNVNSPIELLCSRCFGDISGVTPAPAVPQQSAAEKKPVSPLRLLLADGRQIDLQPGETAGRAGTGGELFMEYGAVSRHHARFDHTDAGWLVTDLESTNGTFLNGQRLAPATPTPLSNGQEIRFGSGFRAGISINAD